MEKKRSVGVTVFAGLEIFFGLMWMLLILYLRQLKAYPNEHIHSLAMQAKAPISYSLVIILYLIILGLLTFKLKNAARILNIFLSPVTAFFIVLGIKGWLMILSTYVAFLRNLFIFLHHLPTVIAVTAAIIFYFTRPKVKEQFQCPKNNP